MHMKIRQHHAIYSDVILHSLDGSWVHNGIQAGKRWRAYSLATML